VQSEVIDRCIEVGLLAPASCNRQAFKCGVLYNNIDKLQELGVGEAINRSLFEKAPVATYIFFDRERYIEKFAPFIDIGMFAQNFVLQAQKEGLSSCCCYASEFVEGGQNKVRKMWELDKRYYCALIILSGVGKEKPGKPPRRAVKHHCKVKKA
jgi:hypothetical protein